MRERSGVDSVRLLPLAGRPRVHLNLGIHAEIVEELCEFMKEMVRLLYSGQLDR